METPHRIGHASLWLASGAALWAAVASTVAVLGAAAPNPTATPPSLGREELAAIIRQEVRDALSQPPTPKTVTPVERASVPDTANDHASEETLTQLLAELRAAARSIRNPEAPTSSTLITQTGAVASLHQLFERDEATAERTLLFRPLKDILPQLGAPSYVHDGTWVWMVDDNVGVDLVLDHGLVVEASRH